MWDFEIYQYHRKYFIIGMFMIWGMLILEKISRIVFYNKIEK